MIANWVADRTQAEVLRIWDEHGIAGCPIYNVLDIIDDGTTLWVDREYYHDGRKAMRSKTDFEYATDLQEFIKVSKCLMDPLVLVDPSAASFKTELNQRGLWLGDVNNDVIDGIRRTGSALKQGKLKIHRVNCPNTCREMPEYAWDEKSAARTGKEAPKKVADHTPDATRYAVNHTFGKDEWRLAS